ncbi:MAG TPA: hypothetical protein VFN38_11375, partial [Gemmatimonadaceae bacterium]|nr:hypothetical protein [Gemmatimonadaceae bacterium]
MRRRVAGILGAVGLVLGAAAWRAPVLFGPDWNILLAPALHRITVAGDTIWVAGFDIDVQSVRGVRYYLVRPGTRWTRVDDPPSLARAREPEVTDTTFELEGGARAHFAWRRDGIEARVPTLTLADGRVVSLHADVPTTVSAGLADPEWVVGPTAADVSFGHASRTWLVTPHAYWFGLDGGFSEGDGVLGGLLRVDRTSGAVVTLAHPYLADVSITSMIAIGDTLFMGTERDGEYGAWGTQGLVRYEPARDRWRLERTGPGGLPDRLIWSVARAGDSLVATTGTGVAIRSLADSAWTSWHFKPQVTDSSVPMALVPVADTATVAELIARYLWQEHLVARPADFVRRFDRLSRHRQQELASAGQAIDALADTLFIPELAALARDTAVGGYRARAIDLLAAMHHPLATLAARGGAATDAVQDAAASIRLVVAGDAVTRDSVTRRMQGTLDDFRWALAVAVGARDDRWVPVIARRAAGADTALRRDIYGALALLATPAATRELFGFA